MALLATVAMALPWDEPSVPDLLPPLLIPDSGWKHPPSLSPEDFVDLECRLAKHQGPDFSIFCFRFSRYLTMIFRSGNQLDIAW